MHSDTDRRTAAKSQTSQCLCVLAFHFLTKLKAVMLNRADATRETLESGFSLTDGVMTRAAVMDM